MTLYNTLYEVIFPFFPICFCYNLGTSTQDLHLSKKKLQCLIRAILRFRSSFLAPKLKENNIQRKEERNLRIALINCDLSQILT
jgi:hypothetical protein